MQRSIRLETTLNHPPKRVWKALTDSKILGQWFMENDILPVLNQEFTFRMAPQKGWDGITHCQILSIEPLKSISYSYKGEASGEKTLACAGINSEVADKAVKGIFASLDTVLSFQLIPVPQGTHLKLEHSGFRGLKLVIVSLVMGMGWKKQILKKLPVVLDRMKEQDEQGIPG